MYYQELINILAKQKNDLGMSESYIAEKACLSQPTVHRIFTGHHDKAAWNDLIEISRVLGVTLNGITVIPAEEMLDGRATILAETMMKITQATSQLEGQGLDKEKRNSFLKKTKHTLLAGSRRRLWMEE